MTSARQLLRSREARRAGTDHGHTLAGARAPQIGNHPAFLEGAFGNRVFDILDRDRRVVKLQRTRLFAGCRADASGDLGEVVGGVQRVARRPPVLVIDEVVPVRDHVVDRTARVAERHTAIHAARGLRLQRTCIFRLGEFAIVLETLRYRFALVLGPGELLKTRWLAHFTALQPRFSIVPRRPPLR